MIRFNAVYSCVSHSAVIIMIVIDRDETEKGIDDMWWNYKQTNGFSYEILNG